MTENRYTDKKYWEHYYQTSNIKIDRIKNIVGLYDEYWDKLISSCKDTPRTIIEIGAYPGRYLAYLSWKYNLEPTALDFNSDTTKIEDCFKSFNVSNYKFIQTDFLEFTTDKKYDLVISNGFVEHFENFEEVMDRHCDYLLPSGAMLIMIPNMRYLKKWYAGTLDSENLKIHNLKVMKLQVFRDFATRNNLKIELLTYFGGFPFTVHQKLNFFQKGIYQVFRRFFKLVNPVIMRFPNRFLSSSIIAIYTKK